MDQSLTVTQLNQYLKQRMDADPVLSAVAVRGELSNYKVYPSGHHYFTLKDGESSLRCVMFRSYAQRLRFRPENGLGVLAAGHVSVYPRDGAYQLYCAALQPLGAGDLQLAFQQLKEKLEKEGLFAPEHKKPLPRFPERIVVITSPAGAAVRDIIRVLGRRWPAAEVRLIPVLVQGAEAPGEIAAAIRLANRWKAGDLIITGRGGGSVEDLWCFNDERVARAIYDSAIPVISAVGHEPDVTIADFVADVRAATPSHAAELAVPDGAEFRARLEKWGERLLGGMDRELARKRRRVEELAQRRVLQSAGAFLDQRRMELDFLRSRLTAAMDVRLRAARSLQEALAGKLDAMSPLKVLSRGYALATDQNGALLRAPEQTAPGERIHLRLQKGALDCQVLGERKEYGDQKAHI